MPDERLAELLRQRALLSQHVAWLDAEITRASGAPVPGSAGSCAPGSIQPAPKKDPLVPAPQTAIAPAPTTSPAPAASASAALAPSAALTVSADDKPTAEPETEPVPEAVALANKRADEIIANYAATDSFNPETTRRSCLLLAIGVFLIGTAILSGIYLLNYR